MSNKLTRKGLAFATSALLTLAGLVAAVPANADVTDVTLNPALGSTYESINQSGVVIATEFDSEDTTALKWRITSGNSNYTTDELLDLYDAGDLNFNIRGGEDEFYFDNTGSSYFADITANEDFSIGHEVDLQGSALVVKAWDTSNDVGEYIYYEDTTYLEIWTEDDADLDDIKLVVRGWVDDSDSEDGDFDNEISADEPRSSSATVTLYDVRTISATTTIESANVGDPLEVKTVLNKPNINTWFVSYDYSLNGAVSGAHFANNSDSLEDAWSLSEFNVKTSGFTAGYYEDAREDDFEDVNWGNFPLYSYSEAYEGDTGIVFLEDTSVNYSSRAWFTSDEDQDADDFVRWLGARSSTTAVVAGTNANVEDVYGFVTDNDNFVTYVGDVLVDVRDGTKSGVVSAQIVDSEDADYKASNVRVRATFSYTSSEEDGELTVTGVTGAAAPGEDLVAFARTDSNGQVAFTFNNANADASDADQMLVTFEVLKSNAVWESGPTMTFNWVDAYVDDFSVSDDALSGSSISLTYEVVDQFGKGISAVGTDEDDVLQVTLTGLDDDEISLDKTALVPQTKSLTNGSATFTFANYAAVDSWVGVAGLLHTADFDAEDLSSIEDADLYYSEDFEDFSYELTYVHKNDATSLVDSVENEYSNVVTYANFYNGNASEDEDLNENIEDYGVWYGDFNDEDEKTWIEGSVLTANDNGAAYQAVTVSGTGLYFQWDREDYVFATGSITIETDADGQFGFYVYSHKHSIAGQSITITSGGKSFTTKLKTYMNPEIDEDQSWNGSEWVETIKLTTDWEKLTGNERDDISAPKRKSAYLATAKVTDVWGNILDGAEVEVYATNLTGTVFKTDGDYVFNEDDDEELNGAADTGAAGTIKFSARANISDYALRQEQFDLRLYVDYFDYDAGTGAESFDFGIDVEGYGTQEAEYTGTFGPQAHAVAGAKKGAVRVHAFNVKGKTVSVFVGGKLVKTVTSDKARFLTVVKGVKAGDKRVTVKVGAKRMLSTFVSVK